MFQILLCLQHAPGFTHTAGHIGFTPPFTVRKFLHFTLQPLLMLCICRAYFAFTALSSLNSVVKQINVAGTLVTGIWKNLPRISNRIPDQIIKPTNALFLTSFIVAYVPSTLHVFWNFIVPSTTTTDILQF
jgi:hypothetical protein